MRVHIAKALAIGVFVLASVATRAQAQSDEGPPVQSSEHHLHVLSFTSPAVDGVDVLVLREGQVTIEHKQWRPIDEFEARVVNRIPRDTQYQIVVRKRQGRPNVSVIQQPCESNRYELRVLIDDPWAGAAPLSFDLYARPIDQPRHPYNVLLITIDTLRADRLGCYGYTRPTSPNLDAFARQCVLFTQMFSTSSFTPPAHASLFTSRYVGDHGVLTWNALSDEHKTLAEVLAGYGYRTGASINLHMLSRQNLGQGFQWRREGGRDGRAIVTDGLDFIRRPSDQPFFLWLHLYDVHRPYGRTPNWTERFNQHGRPGVGDREDHYNLTAQEVRERGLSEQDLQYIVDRYDAGVAYADAQLAPLLAELSTPQRIGDTLIVITSDHGESLRDHPEQLFTHDPFLYAAVTRVPMLIRHPGQRGGGQTSNALTSLIDVAPTILNVTGIPQPSCFRGLSLTRLPGAEPLPRAIVFMECWGHERLSAARTANWLVIRDIPRQSTSFFDLPNDPRELNPLALPQVASPRQLEQRLEAFIHRAGVADEPPTLDEDSLQELRSLGYID